MRRENGLDMEPEPEEADGQEEDVFAPGGNWSLDANSIQTKNAIAPAEAAGADKFDGMMKRDSSDLAWKVAFKTMRKSRVGDNRIPSGFPQLWAFFLEARSLRVFQWGFRKYKELYRDDTAWKCWAAQPGTVGEWHPQKLRACIWTLCDRAQRGLIKESTKKPYTVTKVQNQIISWTMAAGLWDEVGLEAAPSKIRARRNWARVRIGVLVVGFTKYVSLAAKASLTNHKKRSLSPCASEPEGDSYVSHDELFGSSDDEDETTSAVRGGASERVECLSPSLKRVCV